MAACAGALAWIAIEWYIKHKPAILSLASGAISGLVGITPAAGYLGIDGALVIGLFSGMVGYYSVVHLKKALEYDDTLDVFGIHGLVGIWGCLATGLFANPAINGEAGLFYGNPQQLLAQLLAVLFTIAFSLVGTFLL